MTDIKPQIGVCPECKVKENDSSKKQLFKCSYCGRPFCKKHLEPRLAAVGQPALKQASDGHPDFQYTHEKWVESKIRKELTRAKMEALLNRSRAYGKPLSTKRKVLITVSVVIAALVLVSLFYFLKG